MKVAKALFMIVTLTLVFLVVAGRLSTLTLLLGFLFSLAFSVLLSNEFIKDSRKLFQISRYFWLAVFVIVYFFLYESKAHIDVVKRILSPSMPLNPGIVKVKTDLKSDYSLLLLASSISNAPGTLTLYVDRERGELYVHWIDVKSRDPNVVRNVVSLPFEDFAKKMFE
ncbi:MAG: Na+/H+ antiporter subunit E [Acidilobaceae archaeon]